MRDCADPASVMATGYSSLYTVRMPRVLLVQPNGGETFVGGQTYAIRRRIEWEHDYD